LEEIKYLFFNRLHLWAAVYVSPLIISYYDFFYFFYFFGPTSY